MKNRNDLKKLSNLLRFEVVKMSHAAKAPHLASSLSCVDIITVVYKKILNFNSENISCASRDRFILSKGHAATALYAMLNHLNILSKEDILSYTKRGSLLEEHPNPKLPGVEAATGSLGHGLSVGCGIALSSKINKSNFETLVLLSDGECNEGSTWEAALFASAKKLNKLTAIVDFNKWQATGRSQKVLGLDPLVDKFRSFGWEVSEVDGHNHDELETCIKQKNKDKPSMVVAHTVKGKGVSFMEDDNNWHYRIPNQSELEKAKKELNIK